MKIISPNIFIYKFPLTAISSITNRVAGMYMTGTFFLFSTLNFTNENTKNKIYSIYNNLSYNQKKITNNIFLYPFGYHFTGALRHYIWDLYPKFLNNQSVAKSSKFIFFAAIIPTYFLEKNLNIKFLI